MNLFFVKRKIKLAFYWLACKYVFSHFFNSFGKHSKIVSPLIVTNPRHMSIGNRVTINDGAYLLCCQKEAGSSSTLIIGDSVTLGLHNHIVAYNRVEIHDNVLSANNVYISDNNHSYRDISVPIALQGVHSKGPTIIGSGTWIGENVCIISAKIGKNCVIGANSVVTSDVPDYCVAVGNPARVVKKFNASTKIWEKV